MSSDTLSDIMAIDSTQGLPRNLFQSHGLKR